jgi:pimeloyl-ACP methyl ester carboxylesterase
MKITTSGYAPVNGINMYYEIYGEGGTPLVLIHGGGSTINSTFGAILPHLTDHITIIAVELQAHGRTSDRDAPESFAQDAADVAALLNYLKVEKANIMGFSDGACTTLQIAISYPQLVNKIVVVAANYLREGMMPGFFEGLSKATIADMPQPLKNAFLEVTPNEDGLLNMFNKDRAKRLAFTDRTEDELRTIKAPALFIANDNDVITPEHTVKMWRLFPGAKLVLLPGVHGSCLGEICTPERNGDQPKATATLVKGFLGLN